MHSPWVFGEGDVVTPLYEAKAGTGRHMETKRMVHRAKHFEQAMGTAHAAHRQMSVGRREGRRVSLRRIPPAPRSESMRRAQLVLAPARIRKWKRVVKIAPLGKNVERKLVFSKIACAGQDI